MRGKIGNLLWLSLVAILVAAMLPMGAVKAAEYNTISVDPSLVETPDTRFHYPVVGETVGVETYTSVVGETVGVETYTSVVDETIGEGDGTTTEFYLAQVPVVGGSVTIYFAGKEVGAHKYTVDSMTGTVIFDHPPRKRTRISADYQYGNLAFNLAEAPVIPESEALEVDGVPQVRDTDYSIDFWTGGITFLYLLADGATITADYTSYIAQFGLGHSQVDYESETIYVDDVPQTRYVDYDIVDMSGVVTFLYVPADGAVITADYSYWGDTFTVDIKIENATNLWSAGFILKYKPFVKTIVAVEVQQGDFFEGTWYGIPPGMPPIPKTWTYATWFIQKIDTFAGEVHIGYSRLPTSTAPIPGAKLPYIGVYGDGLLATVKFKVLHAGSSPLDLTDVGLYDTAGAVVPPVVVNGAYVGPTADLVMGSMSAKTYVAGDTAILSSKIKNLGSVPLEVRSYWDMYRVEDGQRLQIYSGQIYTGFGPVDFVHLYVNSYEAAYEWGWNLYGVPPYLDAIDSINYIESVGDFQVTSIYAFEDLAVPEGKLIGNVVLEGYTQYLPEGTEDVDIDIYSATPQWFYWLGSLWGTAEWGWHTTRWTGGDTVSDILPETLTEAGLNDLSVLIITYDPGGVGTTMLMDAMRLRVEWSKFNPVIPESYVVNPGGAVTMPDTIWQLNPYDTGTWVSTLMCQYRYAWIDEDGYHASAWISSEKVRTFTWSVSES